MINFLLGGVAGGLLALVGTVAAVRSPAVQERIGIVRVEPPVLARRATEPPCQPVPGPSVPEAAKPADLLFNRGRMWSIPP